MQHEEHRKTGCDIADLKLKFYAAYGVSGEGPRNLEEVTLVYDVVDGEADHVREELRFIQKLVRDDELIAKFASCKNTLERIASGASAGLLLQEMIANVDTLAFDPDRLSNGVFWLTLAGQIGDLAKREPSVLLLPTRHLDPTLHMAIQVIGSQVLMAYVGLVYMRSDNVVHVLNRTDRRRFPILALYSDLLGHDIVRRLRNALAHGNIDTTGVGLRFTDRDGFGAIATPGFLRAICTSMVDFFTTALAVCSRQQENESVH